MNDSDNDAIVVRDQSGRRQFIRRGAVFVAVGGLVSAGQTAYADDCDREQVGEKNAAAANTDSDSGASADVSGCGREPEKPKISQAPESINIENTARVEKIKA